MEAHLLFEQSGTFKREFKKLGVNAYDYDILDDFGETDYRIDLYQEIDKAFEGGESALDRITKEDIVMAFFPCVRFEVQISLHFRGDSPQQAKWSDEKKLLYDLKLEKERARNYELITEMAVVAIRRGWRMVIENPYQSTHYLTQYWPLRPAIVDYDRREDGDYFQKPTQYWFIGFKPNEHYPLFEPREVREKITINDVSKVERSLISPKYASNFIRSYIL